MRIIQVNKKSGPQPTSGKIQDQCLISGRPRANYLTPPSKQPAFSAPYTAGPLDGGSGSPRRTFLARREAARSYPNRPVPKQASRPRGWSGQRDSNPRHQAWEACTLPAELCPLIIENLLKSKAKVKPFFRDAARFHSRRRNKAPIVNEKNCLGALVGEQFIEPFVSVLRAGNDRSYLRTAHTNLPSNSYLL